MKFLYIGSHGSEDPTRAGLNLRSAQGAQEAGHEVEVFLYGDAVVLFNDAVAEAVTPVGFPTIKELMGFMRDNKIPVYG